MENKKYDLLAKLKPSVRLTIVCILIFGTGCIARNEPAECISKELASESFGAYDTNCLDEADLGWNEVGVLKITSNEQYEGFTECLTDVPGVDFDENYIIATKVPPMTSFPYIQEIKLYEKCDGQLKVQIEVIETIFQEANVAKLAFMVLPIQIPEPKVEIIWF